MSAQIDPFHAIAISRTAHRLAAEGRSVIHMEFGQPSTGAPAAAIAEAHRVLDRDGLGYWESVPLKTRIARHYADRYAVTIDPEQVILTCGASPAFVLALSCLFAPGDRIAFARPGYVSYRNTVKALYLTPVEIGCGEAERFQITAAAGADPRQPRQSDRHDHRAGGTHRDRGGVPQARYPHRLGRNLPRPQLHRPRPLRFAG
jgi:aspartate/methionine/tyrosine aminotransferase